MGYSNLARRAKAADGPLRGQERGDELVKLTLIERRDGRDRGMQDQDPFGRRVAWGVINASSANLWLAWGVINASFGMAFTLIRSSFQIRSESGREVRSKRDIFGTDLQFVFYDLKIQIFFVCRKPAHAFGCNPECDVFVTTVIVPQPLQHSSVDQRLQC